ncbi:MAG: type I methionyl aminopeptidase [Patescibacteria group bacterium]|nr:type I methionyl aminopeptidase [Patescibacteria group bacterium]
MRFNSNKQDSNKTEKMREGGKIGAGILTEVIHSIAVGMTTAQLDKIAEDLCVQNKVVPAFKGYRGFPAVLCVGLNDVVVHGIPGDDVLKTGDILSVDFGIHYKGFVVDMARTVCVGKVSESARSFVLTAREALEKACEQAKPGNTTGHIGHAIQSAIEKGGYSIVREMVGHGVGSKLHEDPAIPGYGECGQGSELVQDQTIAIEVITNEGSPEIAVSRKDGWTTRTKDGKLSALFENTVLVSDNPEILTVL